LCRAVIRPRLPKHAQRLADHQRETSRSVSTRARSRISPSAIRPDVMPVAEDVEDLRMKLAVIDLSYQSALPIALTDSTGHTSLSILV